MTPLRVAPDHQTARAEASNRSPRPHAIRPGVLVGVGLLAFTVWGVVSSVARLWDQGDYVPAVGAPIGLLSLAVFLACAGNKEVA